MKSTGIVRKLDELRRIVIPIELCRSLGISEHDPIEIYTEGNAIILKKHEVSCTFCGESNDIIVYKGKNICPACLKELKKI